MHWELETIQREKPEAPPQFDLGLFAEALEAVVEMDEEAKEVRLRRDRLDEWAGVEKATEEQQKEKERLAEQGKEATGKVPEVRINENGNIEVKNGAGGDGRMEVRRQKDEKGNEEVVVTFVRGNGTEGSSKGEEETEPPKGKGDTENMDKTNSADGLEAVKTSNDEGTKVDKTSNDEGTKVDMTSADGPNVGKANSADGSNVGKADSADGLGVDKTVTSADGSNVGKANSAESAVPMASSYSPLLTVENEGNKKNGNGENAIGATTENNRATNGGNEGRTETVESRKTERNFAGGWFGSKFLSDGHGPIGSILKLLFGRKKREAVPAENLRETGDRKIRIFEKLSTTEKTEEEVMTKVVDLAITVDKGGEKQQGETGRDGGGGDGPKTEGKEGKEQKMEIKQYLDQGMTDAYGQKKWEKLAYVWYSEQLYWTTKWIELLKDRVAEVKPELAQKFLFTKTGLAAYEELNEEMAKCEAKLNKLKEWIGEAFK